MTVYNVTITVTGPKFHPSTPSKIKTTIIDTPGFKRTPPFAARRINLIQIVGIPPTLGVHAQFGALLTQIVGLPSTLSTKNTYHVPIVVTAKFHQSQNWARRVTLTQIIGIPPTLRVARKNTITQGIKLKPTFVASAHYNIKVTATAFFHPLPQHFIGAHLTQIIGLPSTVARQYKGTARLSQIVGLIDSNSQHRMFQIGVIDTPGMTDQNIVKMIYKGDHLLDTINMYIYDIDPGGGFTTWAINTRTGAVSEYQNFTFNSMCKNATGRKFLGATSSGLYELDGDTDNGVAIQSAVRNGDMQLAGSRFTQLAGVYIGMRVADDGENFFLKLYTGDNREMTYAVRMNNHQTTKVNIGKGLRARYVSFELIGTGSDFDLDTIEFVPIIAKRRI